MASLKVISTTSEKELELMWGNVTGTR